VQAFSTHNNTKSLKTTHRNRFQLAALVFAAMTASASAALSVYLSANDIQSAETSGFASGTTFLTETFNGSTPALGNVNGYVSPTVGTYTSAGAGSAVQNNDIYGGYSGGKYLGIATGYSATLTLTTPAAYFGLYFTAGDARNSFQIQSGGVTLLTFNTAELIKLLPNTSGGRITAIDGHVYNTQDYYGQPVSGSNSSEPYGYIHIVASEGTTFDKIVLSQSSGGTAVFESDNHSIRIDAPAIPGSLVNVSGAVPEPATGWLSVACLGLLASRRKRARRAPAA